MSGGVRAPHTHHVLLQLLTAAGVLGLLTLVPGPDMAVVTRQALVAGRADAFRAAAGVVLGLMVWGSLAVLGPTALLAASPTAGARAVAERPALRRALDRVTGVVLVAFAVRLAAFQA
jgi:threonine/homoserine/homoserine lactone efflux protein